MSDVDRLLKAVQECVEKWTALCKARDAVYGKYCELGSQKHSLDRQFAEEQREYERVRAMVDVAFAKLQSAQRDLGIEVYSQQERLNREKS